jgi:hypothetical protein
MSVLCIDCKHWNLKDSHLREIECGLCPFEKNKAKTYPAMYPRECGRFATAEANVIGRRRRALGRQGATQ